MSTQDLQDKYDELVRQCASGNIESTINAAVQLSRLTGRMRAINLVKTELIPDVDAVIFDVGANNGSSSEEYRQMFPNATIHSFEPHPAVFEELRQKFFGDIKVIGNNCGVADRSGTLRFNMANQSGSSSFLNISPDSPYIRGIGVAEEESREVPVISVDDYCNARGIKHIDFLKIDVQGFEHKVLEGASGMLARHAIGAIQTEIIFRDFYTQPSSFFAIEQCLQAYGYTLRCIFDIYPAEGSPIFQCDAIYTYSQK